MVKSDLKLGKIQALICCFLLSISPWAVFFSRGAFEANLALAILLLATLFLYLSLSHNKWLLLGTSLLSLSTYAYQAERLLAALFLVAFFIFFRSKLLNHKKLLMLSLVIFFAIQIPQFLLITTAGASIRFSEQTYWGLNFIYEFVSHYINYFSLQSLFWLSDPDRQRSIPNLSVFYSWMVIPFFVGLAYLVRERGKQFVKILLILVILSPVPAALTKDPFSTLRALPLLWSITVIIGIGAQDLLAKITYRKFRWPIFIFFAIISLSNFYSSYFVLFRYERANIWGYGYKEILKNADKYPNEDIVVDQSRIKPSYIEFAFFSKYPPNTLQLAHDPKVLDDYYNYTKFDGDIKIGNIENRNIEFKNDIYKKQILVGDNLIFESKQVIEHQLTPIFEVYDLEGNLLFHGFRTNPIKKCLSGLTSLNKLTKIDDHCKEYGISENSL